VSGAGGGTDQGDPEQELEDDASVGCPGRLPIDTAMSPERTIRRVVVITFEDLSSPALGA